MFSARRKPKRITRDEPEREPDHNDDEESDNTPVVRRPNLAPKSRSKLRTSFAPDEAEDSSDVPVVVKPKARIGPSSSSRSLPRFNVDSKPLEDASSRPSYSKSALEELRNSTPSTPKDLSVYDPSSGAEEGMRDLDLASKFGTNLKPSSANTIPSVSEIAEKKARRARLAKEQGAEDFIPLDDDTLYDSDGEFKPRRMQVGTYLRPDPVEKDTRLVQDDEDILEGFDEYTEDANSNRITMNRQNLLRAQHHDRETIRSLIAHAEGHSSTHPDSPSSSDSDSSLERHHAYETAQTAHGMDGLTAAKASARRSGANRPRQPREITPIPKLGVALGRLRERIAAVELERVKIERRREEIRREKADVWASQEHIQRSLTEAGEELERVLRRVEMERGEEQQQQQQGTGGGGVAVNGRSGVGAERGLNDMGTGMRMETSLTPEPS